MFGFTTPTLIVIAGLPGVGKTTIKRELVGRVRLVDIDTDACWLVLFPTPTYAPAESEAVFSHVFEHASAQIGCGVSTVVEGVFASYTRVEKLERLANGYNAKFVVIVVHCPADRAFARMKARQEQGGRREVPVALWLQLSEKVNTWAAHRDVVAIDSMKLSPKAAVDRLIKTLSPNREVAEQSERAP